MLINMQPVIGEKIPLCFISFVSSSDILQVRFSWDADSFLPPELCCSECLKVTDLCVSHTCVDVTPAAVRGKQ
jgi:hypothetical protein